MTLAIQDVQVRFGGVHALRGVTLDVADGEIHGLIGPNGAGKSVLFDVICGLRRPDSGRVIIDGADVTAEPALRRARGGLRRTFQVPQVFGPLTVMENLLVPQECRDTGLAADLLALSRTLPRARARERERRERAEDLLRRCGLEALRDQYAGSLPIGPARSLEIARALTVPPRLLLLDEPCSGMDQASTEVVAQTIERLTGSSTSVLLVEHDISFVMRLCDRVTVLDVGQTLAAGTPEQIAADPRVRAAYLGQPVTP
jgi:branched-chain amino acid transport system ATP-binding protein